jgi:hypothetical protein
MGTDRYLKVKSTKRPKKRGCEKKRRQKVQARRLETLGVSGEKIKGMTPLAVREMLKRPAKLKR